MPTVQVNSIAMYYERHGTGEPLLLIPGLGAAPALILHGRGTGRCRWRW